jgi:hypothetical protein
MYCRDLKQAADQLGVKIPSLTNDSELPEHHALADARENRLRFEWMQHKYETRALGVGYPFA